MTKSEQKRARDEERVRDRLRRVIAANEARNPGVLVMQNERSFEPPGHVEIQRDDERQTFETDEDAARFISPTDAISVAGVWYVPIVDAIEKLGRAGTFGVDATLLAELREASRLRRHHRREARRALTAWLDFVKLVDEGTAVERSYTWLATLFELYRAQEASRGSRTKARRAELAWLESRDSLGPPNSACGWQSTRSAASESALLEPTDTDELAAIEMLEARGLA